MQINGAGPIYHNYDQPNEIDHYLNVTSKIPDLDSHPWVKKGLNGALTNIHDFIKHILHCLGGNGSVSQADFAGFNKGLDFLKEMIADYPSSAPVLTDTLKAARDFAGEFTQKPIDMFTENNGHFGENYNGFWNPSRTHDDYDTALKSHLESMEKKYLSVFKKEGSLWSTEDGQGQHDSIDTALKKVINMSNIHIPDA